MIIPPVAQNQNNSFSILINQWCNLEKRHKTVSEIKGNLFGTQVLDMEVKYPKQDSSFSKIGFGEPNETHLPAAIASLVPSGFSHLIACTADPEFNKVSDIVKLIKLGSFDKGALQVVVDDRMVDKRLIKDRENLNAFLDKLHVALNKNDLNGLLSESNRDSLLNTSGDQPKIIYQDEKGEGWLVKTDAYQLTSMEDTTAKTEFALLAAMEDAQIPLPEFNLHKTDENRHVLMTKLYDVDSPYYKNGSNVADYQNKYRTVSARELLNQLDYSDSHVTYKTLVRAIANNYGDMNDAASIRKGLMERALFDAMVNNTETSASTLNFFVGIDHSNSIKLTPNTGLMSDQMGNAFLMPISEKYSSQSRIKLNSEFAEDVASVFELDIATVKQSISRIAYAVNGMEVHMNTAGMNSKERFLAKDAFMPKESLRSGIALKNDDDAQSFKSQSQKAFQMASSSKTNSPSFN